MKRVQRVERTTSGLCLTGRDVDVWPVHIDPLGAIAWDPDSVPTPDEAARARSLRFERSRRAFVLSRALLRMLIGAYLAVQSREVLFSYGTAGKPSLGPHVRLRFNVAHADAMALFAFTLDCELGIDIELLRP